MAVTRFTTDVSRDLARQGDDEVFAGFESRDVDTEVNSVVSVASSADRSESTTHGGELQTSYVLRSERLGFLRGRQQTRDLLDVDPVPDAEPAYLQGSKVEYYSCTHQRWLRGVMTLDALDHRVEEYDLGGACASLGLLKPSYGPSRFPEVRRHRYHRRRQHVCL